MELFGYLKKGVQICFLKGDVVEDVAGDEDAFVPGLIILLVPAVLIGLLLAVIVGMIPIGSLQDSGPEAAAATMYISMFKKLSFGLPVVFALLILLSWLVTAGTMHISAKLLKGDGGYLDLFQTMTIPSFIIYIPIVGIWFIVVQVFVLSRVYGLSTGKAIGAYILSLVMMIILEVVVGIVFGVVIAMMFAGGA